MLAALPPSQATNAQAHVNLDSARVPVEFDVLIDCDTVSEETSCFEALNVLLSQHGVSIWRYADCGPPTDVRRKDGAPIGWLEIVELDTDEDPTSRRAPTHATRYSDGKTVSTAIMWGGIQYAGEANATSSDHLLGQAAESARMGILVTKRRELVGRGEARWRGGTLMAPPERAVATLGLILRGNCHFPVTPYSTTGRGFYLALALDSLLPNYGLWAAACSADGAFGQGQIYYLSTATEGRLFQALNARDQTAIAMSQTRIDWVEVADAVDRFLVFLLAAMDATARVVYEIVQPDKMRPRDAKWQVSDFIKALRPSHPSLAALFAKGSPGHDVHLILRQLRNTIHAGGLAKTHVLVEDEGLEHNLSVPLDEVEDLAEAVLRRTRGNPTDWGLRLTDERAWVQPIILVDALTREGFATLDAIFERTPLEALIALSSDAEDEVDGTDEVDDSDRSEWSLMERMLATRGSDMYLWHFGMHSDQIATSG
ncbi:hypothetical protein [Nocardioides antri]|uniref:Uncharacterized protein n=1 Tax=Nocardioides antri TaxID=2607659 RepID=A0A5B1LVE5_9ACTN|nr:hypothetical protein [Nocardioides antri]KAA1424108.1 hypothetical protein F0U47_19645 [Nocardioides antri]